MKKYIILTAGLIVSALSIISLFSSLPVIDGSVALKLVILIIGVILIITGVSKIVDGK
jgi:hypothetical protein